MPNHTLQQLLQKEVSRKEFLTTAAFGMASIFGFGTLLDLLGIAKQHAHTKGSVQSYSFGYYSGYKR